MIRRDVEFYPPPQPYWIPTRPDIEFCPPPKPYWIRTRPDTDFRPPEPPWVSERQTFSAEPKWTPEEDEELLKLEKLYYGRWSEIPHLLSHSPFDCDVRCSQLKEQQMELQDKEREKKLPRTLSELETQISNLENDMKTLKDQSWIASESLKKEARAETEDVKKQLSVMLEESEKQLKLKLEESEKQLKLEIANKLDASRAAEMHALAMVARMTEMLERAQATNEEMVAELRVLKVQSDQWRKAAEAAASMLSLGSNGKYVDPTEPMPTYLDDYDEDSFNKEKENGNVLNKIGFLWKKPQKENVKLDLMSSSSKRPRLQQLQQDLPFAVSSLK